jgi:hypothetical protein
MGSAFGSATNSATSNAEMFTPPVESSGLNFFSPAAWFTGGPELRGTSTGEMSSSSFNSVESHMRGESDSYNESSAQSDMEGESEADIPIFIPVPFKELSSVQYYTPEEQLLELTAALKEQYERHCFIKIHNQKTQPMLVPSVRAFHVSDRNKQWYIKKQFTKQHALSTSEVDRLIESQENALFKATHLEQDQSSNTEREFNL